MRTFLDAKAMAKSLRAELAARDIDLPHGACLELVAAQFEAKSWNVLSGRIGQAEQTGGIDLRPPIPILRSFDEAKALEFYVDFLGFEIDFTHRFHDGAPLYMGLSRGEAALHISEHHGDASPGAAVFLWMSGIEAYHDALIAKSYKYNRPGLEKAPWDAVSMQVSDPFGNRLSFNEHHTDKGRRR